MHQQLILPSQNVGYQCIERVEAPEAFFQKSPLNFRLQRRFSYQVYCFSFLEIEKVTGFNIGMDMKLIILF